MHSNWRDLERRTDALQYNDMKANGNSVGTKNMAKDYGEKNDDRSTMVGIGSWTPSWLQWMANIKWFMPFISIFCLVQGK